MIDRKFFFDTVREHLFKGFLTARQVDGMKRVLDEWERRKLTDLRWLGYMLATDYHETGQAMVPVREGGSDAYLRSKPYWPWVGEGLVQVTWEANARKFGAQKPGDLLDWTPALDALFDGMIQGMFTGRALSRYFSADHDDPVGARSIINGQDRATLIAGFHQVFVHALTSPAIAAQASPEKPAPDAQDRTSSALSTTVARATVPASFTDTDRDQCMRDISNLISAVTLESTLASAAVQALIATQQHLQDAQAQVATLQQQLAAGALDPDQVAKLLDTVSTTTAQLSAAIPANTAPAESGTVLVADTAAVTGASVLGAGSDGVVQARDAAAAADGPAVGTAAAAAPGAFAQPTETAEAGLAAGPGPAVTTTQQP